MRRITLITPLVLVLLIGSAFGVTRESAQKGLVGKGFKFGMNLTKFTGGDASIGTVSPSFRVGVVGGGYIRFGFSQSVGLQLEALYAMKGSRYSESGVTVTFKYDYLEIPALLVFSFPSNSNVTPNFAIGPCVGLKLSSKVSSGGVSLDVSEVKSTDFGLAFGGGLAVKSGKGEVLFDLRYTMGLTKWPDVTPTADVKNSGLMFTMGYGF